MKCNWHRWLWGIVPVLLLGWAAVQLERDQIEQDLTRRAGLALAQGGSGWAGVAFTGRDAVLSGRAAEDNEPVRAQDALMGVWGVRLVDNRADLFPKVDQYSWGAGRRNQRIRISGYAPNMSTRQAILGVAKASFPGFEVVDRMNLARGVPSADTWLAGVSFALKQLASLKRGDVRLDGLSLTVSGEAEGTASFRAVKSALANNLPKGIKLTADQVTPPTVSPYVWGAQWNGGKLVLSGYAPNDAAREELLAAAKASALGAPVIDRMEPGEGAPPGWSNAAIASVKELGRFDSGSAEMKDNTLIVAGVAVDEAAAEAARSALRAAIPSTIKLTDQIKPRDPPPRPAPAETAAVPTPSAPAPAPSESAAPAPSSGATAAPPPAASPAPPPPSAQPTPQQQAASTPPSAPTPAPDPKVVACQDKLSTLTRTGQILFASGSADIDRGSHDVLDKLAAAAKTCPDLRIAVEGHTDTEGSADFNQQLSVRRAQSIVTYLVKAGADPKQLQAVGHGNRRPVAPNDTAGNMAKNRRIEFVVQTN